MRDPYQLVDGIDEMKIRTREDFSKILELYKKPVGVVIRDHRGRLVEPLLTKTRERLTIYSISRWEGRLGESRKEEATRRLSKFGDKSAIILQSSSDAAKTFQDNYFDFVYIDTNKTYAETIVDLNIWWSKAKDGALFSGNNYLYKKNNDEIVKAVNEFVKDKAQELFLTQEDGPNKEDKIRSFYFFKNMAP